MARRSRIASILLLACAVLVLASAAAAWDAFLIEPEAFVANRVDLHSGRLPDAWVGRRILLFSDLHVGAGTTAEEIEGLVDRMQAERPDLVLFLGDAVDSRTPDDPDLLSRVGDALARIEAPLGKYAAVGNHDDRLRKELAMFRTIMDRGGFQVLENESVLVDGVLVGGLAEAYFGNPSPDLVYPPESGGFRILLAHQPQLGMSQEVLSVASPDLVFSGHTHGGQVTFFGLPLPFYRNLLGRYIAGAYVEGGTTLFVTKGIGTFAVRARFFCRPEYVVATLER